MRKYTLFLSVLSFILLSFLSFNANIASASNCAPGDLFNTANGQLCGTTAVVECRVGDLFSSLTGQRCTNTTVVSIYQDFTIGSRGTYVKAIQQILKNEGYSLGIIDGVYGKRTARAISDFQYDNDLPVTGNVDATTFAKLSAVTITPPTVPPIVDPRYPFEYNSPVINGVKGPQTLNVNEQGTWSVSAYDYSKGDNTLSYSVYWGDEYDRSNTYAAQQSRERTTQQNATISHIYTQAGNYTPIFTVTNSNGKTAQTSLSVNVGDANNTPTVTILSPNGGETYRYEKGGSVITVNWKTNNVSQSHVFDVIRLRSYSTGQEYNLVTNILNDGQEVIVLPSSIPIDAYTLEMKTYVGGILVMDSSDSYLKITSGSPTNSAPRIVTGSSPTRDIPPEQSFSFSWTATDPDNDDLSWSVDWDLGDGIGVGSSCSITRRQTGTGGNYNTSYAWAQAGTYQVKVTVSDCVGGSDSSTFTVQVGDVINPSVTVLSPAVSGENVKIGEFYLIRWEALNFPVSSSIYIELRPDNFNIGSVRKIAVASPNSGFYNWQIPIDIIPGQYIFEIYKADQNGNIDPNELVKDVSDRLLTITAPSSGGGGGLQVATIEMQPGNDYYFKGPATLQQIKDVGFTGIPETYTYSFPGRQPMQLFFFPNNPPQTTDSASATYFYWKDKWRKVGGDLSAGEDGSTQTSAYFTIRKTNDLLFPETATFTIPAGITYFGSTIMNGSPRPWQ